MWVSKAQYLAILEELEQLRGELSNVDRKCERLKTLIFDEEARESEKSLEHYLQQFIQEPDEKEKQECLETQVTGGACTMSSILTQDNLKIKAEKAFTRGKYSASAIYKDGEIVSLTIIKNESKRRKTKC